jgi:acetoin utilization deacetylase AcuC-like enzyme
VRFWTHDRFTFPLPAGHRFPMPKYRLLREAVEADGHEVREAAPVSWADLTLAHDPTWLGRVRRGELTVREERALGLPWSPQLVERARRSVQGTVEAMRDALAGGVGMNLGGGTHHAGRAAGRGFCLLNDVAVAIRVLAPGRVLVVDCDVHQGDGTAELFEDDPSVFTLSLHGGANYPFRRARSDLDVDLPDGTTDDAYLDALRGALDRTPPADLVVYLAGADPWYGDRLGRLALTKRGLAARDEMVLDLGAPTCVVLAGGYAPDVTDTVEINLATVRAVATLRAAGP